MRLRRGFLPLVLVSSFIATSCGETPSIDLKNASLPIPGGNNEKPSKPGTGDSTGDDGLGNTTPDTTNQPGGTPRPSPTPTPAPTEPDRLACTASTIGSLIAFSSLVGSDGFGRVISMVELVAGGPAASDVTRDDANVYDLQAPLIARSIDIDRIQVLTIGTRMDPGGNAAPKLYSAIANLSYRTGIATPLASVVPVSGEAQSLASRANLQLRSHGVSLQGRYLLVPTSQGTLKILDSDTLEKLGELPVDPRTNFYPQLDEASGTLAVLRYQSGALAPAFYQVSLKNGKVAPTGAIRAVSVARGTISGPPVLGGHAWVWGEWQSAESGRIVIGSFEVDGLDKSSSKTSLSRVSFVPPETGVRVFPQVTPVLNGGNIVIAVAYERVVRATSGRVPYKVEVAKFALVAVDSNKNSLLGAFDYPFEVTNYIAKNGLEGRSFAVAAVLGSSDLRSAYIHLPMMYGDRVYRLKEAGLDPVSKETCSQLSVQQAK